MKLFLKNILPPFLLKLKGKKKQPDWGWFGKYKNWTEAEEKCSGYDQKFILDKKKTSLTKVRNSNNSLFEMDTVVSQKPIPNYQLYYSLLLACHGKQSLNVIDFGGSLGSSYYWAKHFLPKQLKIAWYIIEQPHIVDEGKLHFETDELQFIHQLSEFPNHIQPDIMLFSGVIQCIENLSEVYKHADKMKIKFLIFDRTPFFDNAEANDAITIQHVPGVYYGKFVTLPCRIHGLKSFLNQFKTYRVVADDKSFDKVNYNFYGHNMYYRFLLLERHDA